MHSPNAELISRSKSNPLTSHYKLSSPPLHSSPFSQASALAALTKQGYMEIARGTTLLGFTATDTLAGLLIATKVTTKATLPGGHSINLVTDARWELLPLDSSSSATNHPTIAAEEQEFWRSMQQHTVGGVHYYCETADLTRPFPSAHPPTQPELEFIWNAWLSQPLRDLGLPNHCPVLMQGAVESVDEVHPPTGKRYTLCLLSRRSRRHPGTRYIARGLNEMAGPGNEIEAELLMWTPSAGSGSGIKLNGPTTISGGGGGGGSSSGVKWARVAWRRGTVPIWWGVELQPLNKGLQAEVYVKDNGPYVGMLSYVRTLQRLCVLDATGGRRDGAPAAPAAAAPDVGNEDSSDVAKVTFINLLHCHPKKAAELMLSSHFDEGMGHVNARLASEKNKNKKTSTSATSPATTTTKCPAPSLMKFDWHGIMGSLNEELGIEAFWSFIEHPVKNAGLALGIMERKIKKNKKIETTSASEDVTGWGEQWQMRWIQRQRGLLRYNCADSLDRTSAATCFAMLPVLQEGLRLLGINLENTTTNASPLRAGATHLASSSSHLSLHNEYKEVEEEETQLVSKSGFKGSQKREERGGGGGGGGVAEEMELPEGWERREHAGRALYIDHVNKVTQWDPPPRKTTTNSTNSTTATSTAVQPDDISPPWLFFNYKLEDVRTKLYADTLADYVTMFRKHGDVHSSLYTGSPAMHSHLLGLVLAADARPYGASSSSVGKLQNLRVAVQRRWNNSVSDSARQQSMELFLGLNFIKYFPRVTSVVPPHPQVGVQSDLAGIDSDDTLQQEEELGAAHAGAELENLHLMKHDGRVGVETPISNLEPLEAPPPPPPPPPPLSPLLPAPVLDEETMTDSAEDKVDDDVRGSIDPLGAVKSPMITEGGGGGGGGCGDANSQFSLI